MNEFESNSVLEKSIWERRAPLVLLAILIIAAVIRLGVFSGITGGDDLIYSYYIQQCASGTDAVGSNHWSLRMGYILPACGVVKLFGFNDATLAAVPLMCSLAGILLIYALGNCLVNQKVGLLAASLLAFYPLDVIYSTSPFLDVPLAFAMGLAGFAFLQGDKNRSVWWQLAAGLLAGWAYLIKATGLYFLLFPFCFAIYQRRVKREYIWLVVGLAAVFAGESAYYAANTGDPLYRFSVIRGTHNKPGAEKKPTTSTANTDSSFFKGESAKGLKVLRGNNWWLEPVFTFTTNQEFGFYFYLIIPISIYYLFKRDKNAAILLLWLLPILIYTLYGSTSPVAYRPLRRWPRYLTPVTFPALLMLAYFLYDKQKLLGAKWIAAILGFLAATSLICVSWFNSGPTDSYVPREIARLTKEKSRGDMLIPWTMYSRVSPFLEFRDDYNVKIYGYQGEGRPGGVYYKGIAVTSLQDARDGDFVVAQDVAEPEKQGLQADWDRVETVRRPTSFFCPWLEHLDFVPSGVKAKLCPTEAYAIYAVR